MEHITNILAKMIDFLATNNIHIINKILLIILIFYIVVFVLYTTTHLTIKLLKKIIICVIHLFKTK